LTSSLASDKIKKKHFKKMMKNRDSIAGIIADNEVKSLKKNFKKNSNLT